MIDPKENVYFKAFHFIDTNVGFIMPYDAYSVLKTTCVYYGQIHKLTNLFTVGQPFDYDGVITRDMIPRLKEEALLAGNIVMNRGVIRYIGQHDGKPALIEEEEYDKKYMAVFLRTLMDLCDDDLSKKSPIVRKTVDPLTIQAPSILEKKVPKYYFKLSHMPILTDRLQYWKYDENAGSILDVGQYCLDFRKKKEIYL